MGRSVCPKGSALDNFAHCYHISAPKFKVEVEADQYLELCCHCTPSYMRINVLVIAMTPELENVMEEHPVYNFTVAKVKSALELPSSQDMAAIARRV